MFQSLALRANRWIVALQAKLRQHHVPSPDLLDGGLPPRSYEILKKVILSDQVSRTLFQEYAAHRAGERGEEETGWVLLGIREADHAVVMATLPAGVRRDAGVGHVRFNVTAEAVAGRILRQWDKRLVMLGVVHTHPGSLRHPSHGDFQGDSAWVGNIRGRQGIFGIGTADGTTFSDGTVAQQPSANVQTLGGLVYSWYALGDCDTRYRPLAVEMTLGPDLAAPLHGIWRTLEEFAEPIERLCLQQSGVTFQVVPGGTNAALVVTFKLAEARETLRVVLDDCAAAYYLQRGSEFLAVNAPAEKLDVACYLILAELAGRGKMR